MTNQFELELRHNFPPEIQRGIVTRKTTKSYVPLPLGHFSQPEEMDYRMEVTCPYCRIKAPVIIMSKKNYDEKHKWIGHRILPFISTLTQTPIAGGKICSSYVS
ncbi:MAG: hypothetical protein ACXAB7_14245 [Candidatus Kariarchaeaceae archaeon]|jgi:hypothetical protein